MRHRHGCFRAVAPFLFLRAARLLLNRGFRITRRNAGLHPSTILLRLPADRFPPLLESSLAAVREACHVGSVDAGRLHLHRVGIVERLLEDRSVAHMERLFRKLCVILHSFLQLSHFPQRDGRRALLKFLQTGRLPNLDHFHALLNHEFRFSLDVWLAEAKRCLPVVLEDFATLAIQHSAQL